MPGINITSSQGCPSCKTYQECYSTPQGHLQGSSSSSVPSGTLRGCLSGRIRGGQGQGEPQGAAESSMHLPGFRALIWNYPYCPFENIPFAAIKVILMTIIEVIKPSMVPGALCAQQWRMSSSQYIRVLLPTCTLWPPHIPCTLPTILTLPPSQNDRQKHDWLVCVCGGEGAWLLLVSPGTDVSRRFQQQC